MPSSCVQNGVRIEGYLKKLKSESSKTRILAKHNKRWFILDRDALTLQYSSSATSRNLSTPLSLKDISSVDIIQNGPNTTLTRRNNDSWCYSFLIQGPKKRFTLSADSEVDLRTWVDTLKMLTKEAAAQYGVEFSKDNSQVPIARAPTLDKIPRKSRASNADFAEAGLHSNRQTMTPSPRTPQPVNSDTEQDITVDKAQSKAGRFTDLLSEWDEVAPPVPSETKPVKPQHREPTTREKSGSLNKVGSSQIRFDSDVPAAVSCNEVERRLPRTSPVKAEPGTPPPAEQGHDSWDDSEDDRDGSQQDQCAARVRESSASASQDSDFSDWDDDTDGSPAAVDNSRAKPSLRPAKAGIVTISKTVPSQMLKSSTASSTPTWLEDDWDEPGISVRSADHHASPQVAAARVTGVAPDPNWLEQDFDD